MKNGTILSAGVFPSQVYTELGTSYTFYYLKFIIILTLSCVYSCFVALQVGTYLSIGIRWVSKVDYVIDRYYACVRYINVRSRQVPTHCIKCYL